MRTFADFGIHIKEPGHIEQKTICPKCSPYRKKKSYPCLNVNTEKGVWNCWHCSWSGSVQKGEDRPFTPKAMPPPVYRTPTYRQTALPARVVDWFAGRGIPESILARNRISYGPVYMPQLEQEVSTIQFPYFRNGDLVNVKYRDGRKYFRMAGGAERLLYGLDDINGDTLIIVEGEMDKLACEVAGFLSCVSVPDGAPAPNTKNYESKFDFLASAEALLQPLRRIILAVDDDPPGHRLAEELARRLGPERCYRVAWSSECKDANDVLMSHGAVVLRECIENAQPWPVSGIVTVDMLASAIDHLYEHGLTAGVSPGWASLAKHYTVRPGEFTIVTGVPSHGKSAWVSALMVNIAKAHDWRFAVFSPENYPLERYAAILLEQYTGERFDAQYGMSQTVMRYARTWLSERVSFLLPEDDTPTLSRLLDLAKIQVYREGIKGLILDPWNEIEHSRPAHQTETEYISHSLTQVRRFARHHGVHVWLIAHPTKLQKAIKGTYADKYPPPTPYDISGSANWRNKADNCVCIWRDIEAEHHRVEVHVQKIRFREVGTPGMVELDYNTTCSRYEEPRLPASVWAKPPWPVAQATNRAATEPRDSTSEESDE